MRTNLLLALFSALYLTACTFTLPTSTTDGDNQSPSNPNADAGLEEKQRGAGTDKIALELGLSAEQQIKYNRIISDYQSKIAGIQANNSLSDNAKKVQLDAQENRKHESIKAILTPQQSAKYDQLTSENTKPDPIVLPGKK
ncbi:MAG: hypothetical protein K9I85_11195 [Saprospiraceae bacterium]|nr:hypothetical protein [Saprospiraceae bacterium]